MHLANRLRARLRRSMLSYSALSSKEPLMLQDLSNSQLEQALAYLANPLSEPPPQPLDQLNQLEWHLLQQLLSNLLEEKESSPVH
jgi:hypothetical protein